MVPAFFASFLQPAIISELFLIIYFIKQQYCFPYSFPKLLWNLYIIFLNLYFLIKFFFEIIYYQFFIFLSNLLIFHLYLFLRWVAGTLLIHWHVILTKFFIRYFSWSMVLNIVNFNERRILWKLSQRASFQNSFFFQFFLI